MNLIRTLMNIAPDEGAKTGTPSPADPAKPAEGAAAKETAKTDPPAPAPDAKKADAPADEKKPDAEKKVEPEQKKPEDDPKFGPKFRALAKRDLAVKQREDALGVKEKKFEAFENFDALAKKDPLAALKVLGIDGDERQRWLKVLAQQIGGKPVKPTVEDDVRELKEKNAREERERAETKTKADQAERTRIETELRTKIGSVITAKKADDYELLAINGDDGVQAVLELMDLTYRKSRSLLSVDEACKQVEAFLVTEARQIADAKKIKVADPSRQPAPATANGQPQTASPTLTSAHTPSTAAAGAPAGEDYFAKTERLGRGLFTKK